MTRLQMALVAVLALALLAVLSLFTVDQTEQALVVRLGKPVDVVREPGLHTKAPLTDTVLYYDTRLLPLEPPPEQIILGDQKRLEVQVYARYQITDPLLYYQSVRTLEQGRSQLTQIVSSALRRALGQVKLTALLGEERRSITDVVLQETIEKAKPLGITVADVRIRRADLPAETSQAIYDRMKSERQRQAKELRAQGFEWAQQIQSHADRERTVILSEAQRQSLTTRGQGDAEANRIYAQAFGRDPKFFEFYRAMQTYRQSLADSNPTLVLSPNSELLKYFGSGATREVRP
ncbi:MAG TPA: protease modulator HflC [Burkholderiaceae bacterium]|nr:protease modulator HflC [Burkholderiaceae bacterium]